MSFKDRVKDFKTPRRVPVDIDGFPDGLFLEERPYFETVAVHEQCKGNEHEAAIRIISVSLVDENGKKAIESDDDLLELRSLPYSVLNELAVVASRLYGLDSESQERIKKKSSLEAMNGGGMSSRANGSTVPSTKRNKKSRTKSS